MFNYKNKPLGTLYHPVSAVWANSPPSPRYGPFMVQNRPFWAIFGVQNLKMAISRARQGVSPSSEKFLWGLGGYFDGFMTFPTRGYAVFTDFWRFWARFGPFLAIFGPKMAQKMTKNAKKIEKIFFAQNHLLSGPEW